MNKWRLSTAVSAMFLCFMGAFTSAFAQEVVVSGSVVDDRGKAVAGVGIKAKGVAAGGFSDSKGLWRVRIPNANGATLVFSYIGFKPFELKATESKADILVKLQEDVLKTSEIVVTGVASSIKKANSPTSIGTISEKELLPAPAQTVDQAFAAKFAGVSIRQNTGAPGGGNSITLRGATTLIGGSQPLYIIDGVIVNNGTFSGGQNTVTAAGAGGATGGATQEQSANRIADINPNDIEDVQVLKGPSAAAAYGAKAASGVIIIKTKQGRAGKTNITVNQQIGYNELQRKLGLRRFNDTSEVAAWNSDLVPVFRAAQAAGNTFIDHEQELYGQRGFVNETDVNVRGGSESTQYSLGGTFRSDQGIVKNTGFERLAGRLNVNQIFSDRFTARIGLNYMRTRSDRGFTGNSNGDNVSIPYIISVMPTFFDARPKNGVYPDMLGLNPANPYEVVDKIRNTEYVNRTIISANVNWDIVKTEEQSLSFVFQGGADFIAQRNIIADPLTTLHQRVKPFPGLLGVSDANNINSNMFLTLVHRLDAGNGLNFTTQAGAQFENQQSNSIVNVANGVTSTLDNVTGAALQQSVQTIVNRYDRGFYAQEDIDISGKFFITASIRGDQSSVNGDVNRFFLFPKAAASVQFANFDFWEGLRGILPQAKLRAAWGQAGTPVNNAAAKFNLLSNLNNNLGGLGAGLAVNPRLGNPDIRPETATEFEVGIDATLGEGIATVELTYYQKRVTDLILPRVLPTSSGYANIFENAATMSNNGFEASVNINAVRTEGFSWTPRINFFTNVTRIDSLSVPAYNSGGFGVGYGANRIQQGVSATAIFGRSNLGRLSATDTVNRAGVWNRTTPEGDSNPLFQVGFANTLKFGNLEFYFLIDWRQGGSVVNLTQALYVENGPDAENNMWGDRAEGKRITDIANTSVIDGGKTPYIQDASFVKFREASLNYTFTKDILAGGFLDALEFIRLGVSGRNLFMITPYKGYDPEVSNFGNIVSSAGQDVAPFPSSRSLFVNLSFGF